MRNESRSTPLLLLVAASVGLSWGSEVQADVPLHGTTSPIGALPLHAREFLAHVGQEAAITPAKPSGIPQNPSLGRAQVNAANTTVYGYWPYWGDDLNTLPWETLTHLAIFGVTLNADGTLSSTSYWTNYAAKAMQLASPYGVRVHMTVISFDASVMTSVLGSATKRATAVSKIEALVKQYGAHGVNLDFEGLPSSQKANLVTFLTELKPKVGDVTLAMPAVDWNGSYDYDQLALNSDGLFIMGYDYHYSGGSPGPVSPLFGGSPWGTYCLEWTVDDYQTWGAPANRLILGLPLYGIQWPTTSTAVPGTATATGSAKFYEAAVPAGLQYGRKWDSVTHTPYTFPSSTSQLWYDDQESLEDKIEWALAQGIQGIGFWAMTYDGGNTALWQSVQALASGCTTSDADGDGISNCAGDCDDLNPAVKPGAVELCDGRDNNCNGTVDEGVDGDGDGVSSCFDCDDANGGIYPGSFEACDSVDNDCDGQVDDVNDADGDGFGLCDDCNDGDPNVNPSAPEQEGDGVDNDCDGEVDESSSSGGCTARERAGNPLPYPALTGVALSLLFWKRRRSWRR